MHARIHTSASALAPPFPESFATPKAAPTVAAPAASFPTKEPPLPSTSNFPAPPPLLTSIDGASGTFPRERRHRIKTRGGGGRQRKKIDVIGGANKKMDYKTASIQSCFRPEMRGGQRKKWTLVNRGRNQKKNERSRTEKRRKLCQGHKHDYCLSKTFFLMQELSKSHIHV